MLWGEFDRETQAFGLATTGGTVSNTGIAGLTLGGDLGWLMGKHGLTVDNLLSADADLTVRVFLGYCCTAAVHGEEAFEKQSGRRDLNPRPLDPQSRTACLARSD